ncbi:uncharacterized protein BJ171DRAFT_542428, partial [Polychytrium aggregatum]|uniref:uncharacterized protein n=1 Tax=Polychytrium aggregatum TaxID=110093 RepID=UPI0022FF288F
MLWKSIPTPTPYKFSAGGDSSHPTTTSHVSFPAKMAPVAFNPDVLKPAAGPGNSKSYSLVLAFNHLLNPSLGEPLDVQLTRDGADRIRRDIEAFVKQYRAAHPECSRSATMNNWLDEPKHPLLERADGEKIIYDFNVTATGIRTFFDAWVVFNNMGTDESLRLRAEMDDYITTVATSRRSVRLDAGSRKRRRIDSDPASAATTSAQDATPAAPIASVPAPALVDSPIDPTRIMSDLFKSVHAMDLIKNEAVLRIMGKVEAIADTYIESRALNNRQSDLANDNQAQRIRELKLSNDRQEKLNAIEIEQREKANIRQEKLNAIEIEERRSMSQLRISTQTELSAKAVVSIKSAMDFQDKTFRSARVCTEAISAITDGTEPPILGDIAMKHRNFVVQLACNQLQGGTFAPPDLMEQAADCVADVEAFMETQQHDPQPGPSTATAAVEVNKAPRQPPNFNLSQRSHIILAQLKKAAADHIRNESLLKDCQFFTISQILSRHKEHKKYGRLHEAFKARWEQEELKQDQVNEFIPPNRRTYEDTPWMRVSKAIILWLAQHKDACGNKIQLPHTWQKFEESDVMKKPDGSPVMVYKFAKPLEGICISLCDCFEY